MMSCKVLATFHLTEVDVRQRSAFLGYLEAQDWKRIPQLSAAWTCQFDSDVNSRVAFRIATNEFRDAAKAAGVTRDQWKVAIQVGTEDVFISD